MLVKLKTPIKDDFDNEVTELNIPAGPPTIGGIRGASALREKDPEGFELKVLSNLTGYKIPVLEQITLTDWAEVDRALGEYFQGS